MQINPDYIVGLVDGEGSFTAFVRDPSFSSSFSRRVRVEPRFYIKLIEKDRIILEQVQQFFGCGKIYYQKDKRPNHQNCYRYEVFNRDELVKIIIPFFKQNTLKFPSKKRDFKIFCEMLELISENRHLTDHGLNQLLELKQLMH